MYKKTALILFVLLFALSACTINGVPISIPTQRIQGSGDITTETRNVSDFTQVDMQGIGNLTIEEGTKESLTISADDNLLQYITTEVAGGALKIGMEPNLSIDPTKPIEYKLTVKSLSSITLSGFGDITADKLSGDDLEVRLAGSGNITLGEMEGDVMLLRISGFGDIDVDMLNVKEPTIEITGSGDVNVDELTAENLFVKISGFGNADLAGLTETQDIQLIGSGNYMAGNLESDSAVVKVTGFGDSTLWAKDNLDVTLTGSGDVEYYGNPRITQTMTGFGKVNSLGER